QRRALTSLRPRAARRGARLHDQHHSRSWRPPETAWPDYLKAARQGKAPQDEAPRDATNSNFSASSSGFRPARTISTSRRLNSGRYGGRDLGIVNSSSLERDLVSTKPGALHGTDPARQQAAGRWYRPVTA